MLEYKDRATYDLECRRLTDLQPLQLLPYYNERKHNGFSIDHIVPISYGFKLGIPVYVMADMLNLQVIPTKDNISKSDKMTDNSYVVLAELVDKYRLSKLFFDLAIGRVSKSTIQSLFKKADEIGNPISIFKIPYDLKMKYTNYEAIKTGRSHCTLDKFLEILDYRGLEIEIKRKDD